MAVRPTFLMITVYAQVQLDCASTRRDQEGANG